MQPRCGSEIKILSPRNYLVQVRSHRQHGQRCHSPVPGECELHCPFVHKKIFTLPVESHPIHFHRHVADMCESALIRYLVFQQSTWSSLWHLLRSLRSLWSTNTIDSSCLELHSPVTKSMQECIILFTDTALYKYSVLSLLQVSVVLHSLNQQYLLTINLHFYIDIACWGPFHQPPIYALGSQNVAHSLVLR